MTVSVSPTTTSRPPGPLTVDGHALPDGGASLSQLVGHLVVSRGTPVIAVVTHNGFWVGSGPADRVWVELVGPLRTMQVTVGDHVSFVAPLVAQPPSYAAAIGVDAGQGAAQLTAEGAHIVVPTTAIAVGR